MKNVLNRLAFVISALASPFIVLIIFSLWTVAAYSSTPAEFLVWGGTGLTFSVLVPLLYVLYGVKRGFFSDMHLMFREQRAEPYKVANVSALLLVAAYSLEGAPRPLLALAVALFTAGICFYWITAYWKISMHVAALTGSIVIAALLITPRAWWLLLLIPLVIWARLYRQRHTSMQAVVAALAVSLVIMAVFRLMRVI